MKKSPKEGDPLPRLETPTEALIGGLGELPLLAQKQPRPILPLPLQKTAHSTVSPLHQFIYSSIPR